jgi:hypothetical protein
MLLYSGVCFCWRKSTLAVLFLQFILLEYKVTLVYWRVLQTSTISKVSPLSLVALSVCDGIKAATYQTPSLAAASPAANCSRR